MTGGDPMLAFPDARYRRIIEVRPEPGVVSASMADYAHHFTLSLAHAEGVITSAEATGIRVPWSACPGGAGGLALMVGSSLSQYTSRSTWASDRAGQCVHVLDLADVAVAHAGEDTAVRYVAEVAPAARPRRRAELRANDALVLAWDLDGDTALGADDGADVPLAPGPFFAWLGRAVTDRAGREAALVLRRACHMGASRAVDLDAFSRATDTRAADNSCFTYRPEVASVALRVKGSTRATEADD